MRLAARRLPTMAMASKRAPTERSVPPTWRYGFAVHRAFSRSRAVEAEGQAHGRRLAGPVGAEEASHLPATDRALNVRPH
jgi:hypothetical protein